jgi:hypothetical protein
MKKWKNFIHNNVNNDIDDAIEDDVGIFICDITFSFNNKFHENWPWICLSIISDFFFTFSITFDNYLISSHVCLPMLSFEIQKKSITEKIQDYLD